MFIRVKRKKTTYFLHCDPFESVLETKQKLQALCDVHVDKQRLILVEPETILDEAKSLEEQQVSPCLWLNKITNLRFIHLHNCFSFIFPSYKCSYLGFNVHIYELFIKRIHVYKKTSFIWKNATLSNWKVFLFELGGLYCQIDF